MRTSSFHFHIMTGTVDFLLTKIVRKICPYLIFRKLSTKVLTPHLCSTEERGWSLLFFVYMMLIVVTIKSWVYTRSLSIVWCHLTFFKTRLTFSYSESIDVTGRGVRRIVVYGSFKERLSVKDVTFFTLVPPVDRTGGRTLGTVL